LIFALPTLYKDWGFPETLWSVPHFLFVFSGAVSMIFFGLLEKRIAPVKLIFYSMLLIAPFSLMFLMSGATGSLLSLFWVALLGFILFSSLPANVVLGQKKMPEYAATISGILMGAAWGTASFSPLFISTLGESGLFSIKYGKLLPGTAIIGILPVFGALLCLVLGREQKQPKL
jgi:FSR family fosmidomycin resistance protein-like MFS transporter